MNSSSILTRLDDEEKYNNFDNYFDWAIINTYHTPSATFIVCLIWNLII